MEITSDEGGKLYALTGVAYLGLGELCTCPLDDISDSVHTESSGVLLENRGRYMGAQGSVRVLGDLLPLVNAVEEMKP
jgi:hypothetical protein